MEFSVVRFKFVCIILATVTKIHWHLIQICVIIPFQYDGLKLSYSDTITFLFGEEYKTIPKTRITTSKTNSKSAFCDFSFGYKSALFFHGFFWLLISQI